MARIDKLRSQLNGKYGSEVAEMALSGDPSDNLIYAEYIAKRVSLGDHPDDVLVAVRMTDELKRARLLASPTIPYRRSPDEVIDGLKRLLPEDVFRRESRVAECLSDDPFVTTARLFVVDVENHREACCLNGGQSSWCVADPDDRSEFQKFDQMEGYFGVRPKLYMIFSRTLPDSHKYSQIAGVFYPYMEQQMQNPMQYIRQARQRFRMQYGTELKYSDEFLLKMFDQLKENRLIIEVYDKNNDMILPDDLRRHLGDTVFETIFDENLLR